MTPGVINDAETDGEDWTIEDWTIGDWSSGTWSIERSDATEVVSAGIGAPDWSTVEAVGSETTFARICESSVGETGVSESKVVGAVEVSTRELWNCAGTADCVEILRIEILGVEIERNEGTASEAA